MKSTKVLMVSAVLALSVGCAGTAFAESSSTVTDLDKGPGDISVTGEYVGTGARGTVYSVNVVWDDMKFTYTTTGDLTWNPSTHTYDSNVTDDGVWKTESNEDSAGITVTNHSNAAVDTSISFAKNSDVVGTYVGTMQVQDGHGKTLAAGVENEPNNADSLTSELSFSGTLAADTAANTQLGTVTVQLSAA